MFFWIEIERIKGKGYLVGCSNLSQQSSHTERITLTRAVAVKVASENAFTALSACW